MVGLLLVLAAFAGPHTELAGVTCLSCHEDPHGTDRACSDCHGATAWSPSSFTLSDHAALDFPLEGRHLAAPCASCHVGGKLAPLPRSCDACHTDPHRGKLDSDCASCHSVEGWRPVPDFEHARTGFDLAGPHAGPTCTDCHDGPRGAAMSITAEVTCRTCHEPDHGAFRGRACDTCHPAAALAFDAGPPFDHHTTAFALERRHKAQGCAACHPAEGEPEARCAACHLDPHGGEMTLSCEDCHRPDRWRLARFDHDRTGFPLQGRHFTAPCGTCHTNQRWIGLPQACADCHAFDAAQGPASIPAHTTLGVCSDCHTSTFTWTP